MQILKAVNDSGILKRMISIQAEAQVHVMEMWKVKKPDFLGKYLSELKTSRYDHVLGVVPTGWTHEKGSSSDSSLRGIRIKRINDRVSICSVPYREHSSYFGLKRFVKFLKLKSAGDVIPTVNVGNPQSRAAMTQTFKSWLTEDQSTLSKFVQFFTR